MRIIISLLLVFSTACSVAQPGRLDIGTKKKGAEKQYEMGKKYYQNYDYNNAIKSFTAAIEKDPEYISPHMMLGQIYWELGQYAAALNYFKKVIGINPQYPDGHFFAARLHFELENYGEAKATMLHYQKLDPKPGERREAYIQKMLIDCEFAMKAVANPVDFNPINMGPNINSEHDEYFPALTIDGSTFIFTRQIERNEDFYMAKMQDSVWQKAYNIGKPINTPLNEGAQTISGDGKYIFYTACNRMKGMGSCDIYFSALNGDKWSDPQNLGKPINTGTWESQPSISADGLTLYFSSAREGGYGGYDIWASDYTKDGWSTPYNLGPGVNTSADEQSPFIHPDSRTLYFSSEGWPGMGGSDIYFSRLGADNKWQKAENLGYPINTPADENSMVVDRTGKLAFYASDRDGGLGGLDFYMFELPERARPKQLSYVKGNIFDADTKQPLAANVELIDLETGKTVVSTVSARDGSFLVILEGNKDYALNVNKEGYLFHSENFSLTQTTSLDPYNITVYLEKISQDKKIVMRNVFFETGKYELKPESKAELNKLVDFLKANPNISIEVGGHTDNVGSETDNQKLSQNRANSVMKYLISQGIDANRLTAKGYGESEPMATNDTAEGRAQNRRTEIKITK